MIIYNVTIKLDPEIHEDWLSWMRRHHIPEVLATGYFVRCRLSKLDVNEEDGITYAVQYECFSSDHLQKYMMLCAPALQKKHIDRYANRFVAFRTILQVIEEIFPADKLS
ncbi:MAG: DUF4286 family protein [Saprospiraceae bacterium]|jgi:hypothetical protein|nr:DUF4286 family protein [Saprospiraceae bacterium]MBK7795801.1 DUF4286 family protein [Saprospiraceae bacterium]MBK8154354.1 DUF4286 family protein [Saprospiraceae bacterium]MBK9379398.1 DUF4286 family protein [Saprospiraceae bacterium]MBL0260915.1 DUF4286 family protein [Saprospiraceae bacterium]